MPKNEHDNPTRCPYCGKQNEAATNVTGEGAPGEGAISFCVDCGHFGFFAAAAAGGIRRASALESAQIASDSNCFRIRVAWEKTNAMFNRQPVKAGAAGAQDGSR